LTNQLGAHSYFFPLDRCVSAEPADVLADLLEFELRSVVDAALAALLEVTFGGALCWESAEPAADFADLLDSLLRKTFDAAEAARLLVTSGLLDMTCSCGGGAGLFDEFNW